MVLSGRLLVYPEGLTICNVTHGVVESYADFESIVRLLEVDNVGAVH
jgi:hypothetical protein